MRKQKLGKEHKAKGQSNINQMHQRKILRMKINIALNTRKGKGGTDKLRHRGTERTTTKLRTAENDKERKNIIEKITEGEEEGKTKRNNRMKINESRRIWNNLRKEIRGKQQEEFPQKERKMRRPL